MKFDKNDNQEVDINIVPLLDTIFILLIFFSLILISATFLKSFDIKLPGASNTKILDTKVSVISINISGEYFIDNKIYSKRNFWKHIKNNKKKEYVIKADKRLKFGFVINFMDKLRNNGIKKVYFETESKENEF
ncbi:MAG TPA: biopolymer transporter ExbD [Candidatus Mcinerneyibacterium sp.]|nr:biopolymer transporter ExbD [Candidatus Mcinerneyibacterium sp.]